MAKLRSVKPQQAIRVLERLGFQKARQKGSHVMMSKPGHPRPVVVPVHGELAVGTLRSIIRSAGIDVEAFQTMLQDL